MTAGAVEFLRGTVGSVDYLLLSQVVSRSL